LVGLLVSAAAGDEAGAPEVPDGVVVDGDAAGVLVSTLLLVSA